MIVVPGDHVIRIVVQLNSGSIQHDMESEIQMSLKSFRFRLILNHPASQQDEIGEQLCCGGHDDFVVTTDRDLTALDAEMNAASLEDAMSTAVRCIHREGFGVAEIQINSEHFSQIAWMDD